MADEQIYGISKEKGLVEAAPADSVITGATLENGTDGLKLTIGTGKGDIVSNVVGISSSITIKEDVSNTVIGSVLNDMPVGTMFSFFANVFVETISGQQKFSFIGVRASSEFYGIGMFTNINGSILGFTVNPSSNTLNITNSYINEVDYYGKKISFQTGSITYIHTVY